MKTATVRELRNHYKTVLACVEKGEEVAISRYGKIVARLVPEKPSPRGVDWSKSAAVRLDRKGWRVLSAKESTELLSEAGGKY